MLGLPEAEQAATVAISPRFQVESDFAPPLRILTSKNSQNLLTTTTDGSGPSTH